MKKTYKLENLDCANCAARMEHAIRRLDGVQSAAVSFMAQKLVLEADDTRFDEVFKQVVKACKKVEPDLVIQA